MTDAVRRVFHIAPAQALEDVQAFWHRIHPEDLARVHETLDQSAASLLPWRCEFRVNDDRTEAWRDVHATPHREVDGTVVWNGFMADITERRHMEAGLREKEAANLRPDQCNKLGHIETAGQSLLRLINELLEVSRIESGAIQLQMEPLALASVLSTTMSLAEPLAAQRRVQLVCEGDQSLAVHADRHRLGQVLLNLLSNAIKYGPAGGLVTVHLARLDDGAVEVGVQDEGPGLTQAQQAQLFQAFNRLGAEHGQIEGVGLGLVITRGLVGLMEGQLQVVDSGQAALHALSEGPWPSALLLDMHLADMDGLSLLQQLRAQPGWAGCPIVAVSADAMPDDIQRALDAGFADYWTKPIDITRVQPALKRLLSASPQ